MAKTYLKPIQIPSEVSLAYEEESLMAKGKLGEFNINSFVLSVRDYVKHVFIHVNRFDIKYSVST